jgi:ferric-dicitrate binding protein FerR (iron transport regulator)
MSRKAPQATQKARPQPSARETKSAAKSAVKSRKQGVEKRPKRRPKLSAKRAKELAAQRAARRKVLLVVGDYALGMAMLAGAVWWLVVFLERR